MLVCKDKHVLTGAQQPMCVTYASLCGLLSSGMHSEPCEAEMLEGDSFAR